MTASYANGQIQLEWQGDGNARQYEVSRKILGEQTWTEVTTQGGSATGWTDGNILPGQAYEYRVIKRGSNNYDGFGYIAVGADRSMVENRGRCILLVAQHLSEALPVELQRLERDLVGDGWQVARRNVPVDANPLQVKDIIRVIYNQDPANTKALFIFGHLAVPYSGDLMPDGHEDHRGAWPADVFYGEFDGQWTDDLLVRTNGFNRNIPNDGRFDQSYPPGPVRLQIGRVDLANLTCFANKTPARYEVDLARQYLNKNHNFRHGRLDVRRRALVFDREHRGTELEPQTSMAYRSFPGFFGREQIRVIGQFEYFPILESEPHLWTYVVSGGSQVGSDYIGTSDSFALNDPKVVFTSFLGSYFGDWDRESNFLRSILGSSSYTLASMYGGQPAWLLHPMAIGEPIGYSALLTQNNRTNGTYVAHANWGIGQVHIALLGDPTLRLHPVQPVRNLIGGFDENGARMSWTPSLDLSANGVLIYKSTTGILGPYTKLTEAPITGTSFSDPTGQNNGTYYMVRAIKREVTPSGTYFNLSQGMYFPDGVRATPVVPAENVGISKITPGAVTVEWLQRGSGVRGYQIQRRNLPTGTFATVGEIAGDALSFVDRPQAGGSYAYRVKTLGFGTEADFSNEARINLQPSAAWIAGVDTTTSGNWIGKYGQEGVVIPYVITNVPTYANLTSSNMIGFVTSMEWKEPNGVQRPDGEGRVATYWYGGQSQTLGLRFRFHDDTLRRVTVYLADYHGNRSGKIEVIDPFSNVLLASTTYANVTNGVYVQFDVRNSADIRLVPTTSNPAISAIFFSTPPDIRRGVAEFVGIDSQTRGDWQTLYGQAGWAAVGAGGNFNTGIQFTAPNSERWTWTTSATDPRALNVGGAGRLASAWYTTSQFSFDMIVPSEGVRPLALYFYDWDFLSRVEDIIITDSGGQILDQRRLSNFGGGQYLVWDVRGSLRVTIRHVSGQNALLNGIFLGPERAVVNATPPTLASVETFDGSAYNMRILGQAGQRFVIQSSSDLASWQDVDRVTLSGNTQEVSLPFNDGAGVKVYRARLEQ